MSQRSSLNSRAKFFLSLSAALLMSTGVAAQETHKSRNQNPTHARDQVNAPVTGAAGNNQLSAQPVPAGMLVLNVADIVDKVNKAVVNIQAPGEDGGISFGSGFCIDDRGLIVTNFHVIRDALKDKERGGNITVVTTDSERYTASLKGYDESTDIALLEIKSDNKKLTAVKLGDSDGVRVGEWAVAVGSPYGLDHTVTLGIISAKNRSGLDGEYDDYLQTDASINFGNSGGPLINTRGEVIGINTLVLAKGNGLGFAIPVNILKEVIPQLRDNGRVRRSSLNIETSDISIRSIQSLRLPQGLKGVVVSKVERDTPAARAGLRRDDIILSVNNTPVISMGQFNRMISRLSPGSKVDIKIRREEQEFTVNAELVEKK
jgi:serine protease Do